MSSLAIVNERGTARYYGLWKDETGAVMDLTALDSLLLTVYDLVTQTVLNSRDAQNALNANGVTVFATAQTVVVDGDTVSYNLTWLQDPADNVIIGATQLEQHEALFVSTSASGAKRSSHVVTWTVRNLRGESLVTPPTTSGLLGSLLYRDPTSASGTAWLPASAVGKVLVSQGESLLPVWSANPTLAGSLTLPAMAPGGVTGVFAGTQALVRIVQPALAAGGQAQGRNVFVGGAGNTTLTNGAEDVARASNNVGVGVEVLQSVTSGFMNTAIGVRALKASTTGMYQVAVGEGALLNNATNVGNVAVGTSALRTLLASGGDYNTGLGHDALEFLQTGTNNVAVGKRAAWQMTAGSGNTALGANTLYSHLTGDNNVAVGMNALYFDTGGSSNTAIGHYALNGNTTGVGNVAVGQGALLNTTTQGTNTAVGAGAGRYQADGATALAATVLSVYLGYQARGKDNSDSNSIVIGGNAIGAGANTAVIGNSAITDVYLGSSARNAALRCAAITSNGGAQTFGANDSGGAGYRLVRVPNA